MLLKTLVGVCASVPLAFATPALAKDDDRAQEIEKALQHFEKDPKSFMNEVPKKHRPIHHTKFKAHHKASAQLHKYAHRLKKKRVHLQGKEAAASNDAARDLVDRLQFESLAVMDQRGLTKAQLAETPWSDDYWAIFSGGGAKRYADSTISYGENWKKNVDQVKKAIKRPLNAAELDKLSPAEKYDLLIGADRNAGLTNQQLEEGRQYAKTDGSGVETWMGHCHGWAPAAYMVPRPKKTIVVKSADGKLDIPFYPADLRALGTLLWANTEPFTKFIGGRCNTPHPPQDSIGRLKEAACRDVNPSTWHKAVVNQIGVAKRSMVLDVTFDYEVWNQPFYSYKYTYFNPKTGKHAATLAAATVKRSDFPKDKFKAYRAAAADSIVGIAMDVHWVVETQPTHKSPTSAADDLTSGARYLYTLELDAAGKIIGGEWLQNAHPDFLWTPPAGTRARSPAETSTVVASATSWDAKGPLPATLATTARGAAGSGDPLGAIIEALAKRAAQ
jgi:hypothetical protein